jgi:hypothetical protein
MRPNIVILPYLRREVNQEFIIIIMSWCIIIIIIIILMFIMSTPPHIPIPLRRALDP